MSLQPFELQVMVALYRSGGETYSVPLVLALEAQGGRRVSQAAVFIVLRRLERKRLVSSRLETADQTRTRRYFKLTRTGVAAMKEQRVEHARLWRGLGRMLRASKG